VSDVIQRDYRDRLNPPILHRKEAFVTPDYPHYQQFAALTRQEEECGALGGNTRTIGILLGWEKRLQECGVVVLGHEVVRIAA
jgi:hypothetical protein